MGDTTAIEWATATWNPWWGCRKVSPGCTNCYAETLANRFYNGLWRGQHRLAQDWGLPGRVDRKAGREGRRARMFVLSMGDAFEDDDALIAPRDRMFGVIEALRYTDVLLLTKRPENVIRMVPPWWTRVRLDIGAAGQVSWPAHIWLGTTVEDQQRADERIPHLLRVPAPVRFLSVEPLLGPVDLPLYGVSWVIAGGESGPRARPMAPEWARSVRDQCGAAGVPFFFKQWGGRDKKAAGRLLDGREHHEFPGGAR